MFELREIQRKPGPSGLFHIAVQTPDGPVQETLRPSRIHLCAQANAGRDEPHNKRAFALYTFMIGCFPKPGSSLEVLRRFAQKTGYELPETATDESLAWEAMFGETPEVSSSPSYGPVLDIEDEDGEDVLSGLKTQAEGKAEKSSGRKAATR